MKELYFIREYGNGQKNLVKIVNDSIAYAYDGKGWIESPNLISIMYDLTDYDLINEEEVQKMIEKLKE